LVCSADIQVFVMSCRVIGLEVELAALGVIENLARENGEDVLQSQMIDTDRNTLSRDLFERAGYIKIDNRWCKDLSQNTRLPSHITVEI
jgi:predicted enzyme involved in methoxymalonyl-ACP biosynthesis